MLEQLIGALQIALKGVEALVIPARQDLLRTAFKVRRMHVNGLGLPNSIKPADALLEQFGIEW